MARITRSFILSGGTLLLGTSVAKFLSICGSARILQNPDPILIIPFRYVFLTAGLLELFVAIICIFGKRVGLQISLVAWLATIIFIYRVGLLLVNYHKPCACLGNLTDALNISPQTADTAMKIILAYLLIGSYAALFSLWNENRKTRTLATSTSANGAMS
jgi:hypothetical protein